MRKTSTKPTTEMWTKKQPTRDVRFDIPKEHEEMIFKLSTFTIAITILVSIGMFFYGKPRDVVLVKVYEGGAIVSEHKTFYFNKDGSFLDIDTGARFYTKGVVSVEKTGEKR